MRSGQNYEVKWAGRPERDNTWVHVSVLTSCASGVAALAAYNIHQAAFQRALDLQRSLR